MREKKILRHAFCHSIVTHGKRNLLIKQTYGNIFRKRWKSLVFVKQDDLKPEPTRELAVRLLVLLRFAEVAFPTGEENVNNTVNTSLTARYNVLIINAHQI